MEPSVIQSTGAIVRTLSHEPGSAQSPSPKNMPELPQPFDEETSALDAPSQRWKPLVGTPSKSPIPQDILVPDPSPRQLFANPESPVPDSSSPTSFVHKRRQGEYVPRPPVWTVHNPDGALSAPAHQLDREDNLSISSSESVALELKRASHPKHENCRISTKSPNYTHAKIPSICDNGHGDALTYEYSYVKIPPRPEQYDPRRFSLESSRTVSRNGPPLSHNTPEVGSVASASNPLVERNLNSMEKREGHLSTASFSEPSLAKGGSWIASDYRKNIYSFMEGPARSEERISSYTDLRFSPTAKKSNPLSNKMVSGSVVISVGRTVLPDGINNKTSDFGVHLNRRYIVAEIYGDYWALLVKLEPGLRLGEIERSSNLLGKRAKPKPPIQIRLPERTTLLGVYRDPEFIVFAPLCAFTLDTDPERSPQSRPVSLEIHETISARGYAQATTPTYSAAAEADMESSRWAFIPNTVYYRYVYLLMSKAERAGTLPILDSSGAVKNGPSGTENSKPTPAMRAHAEWRAKAIEYHNQTGQPIKNTPRQSIRDFFSRNKSQDRLKLGWKISEVNESAVNLSGADNSRPDRRSVVSELAPKVELQSLPTSFQDFSLNSQLDRSSDQPSIYPHATVPRDTNKLAGETSSSDRKSASLETRASSFSADNPVSSTKPDLSKSSREMKGQSADIGKVSFRSDAMPSSTKDGQSSTSEGNSELCTEIDLSSTIRGRSASSAELAVPVPVERFKLRNSSDPTPKPKHNSPLTMPPAHVAVRDIVNPLINNKDSKNGNKSTMKTLRAAGETVKRVFPAIIERCRKSNTQKTTSIQGDGSVRSTSNRFVEPCKSVAKSLTNKRKSQQRKSILSGFFRDTSSSDYQTPSEMQTEAQPVPTSPAVGQKTKSQIQLEEIPVGADSRPNAGAELQDEVDEKAATGPFSSATPPKLPPIAGMSQQKEHSNHAEGSAFAPIVLEQQQLQKHLSVPELPPRYRGKPQEDDTLPPIHLASPVKVETSNAVDAGPTESKTVPGLGQLIDF